MTAIISGALIHFYSREPHVLISTLKRSLISIRSDPLTVVTDTKVSVY